MKDKHKHAFMDIAKRFAECSTASRLKVGAICVHENENQIINKADISGIFNAITMEDKTRRKNGDWKCESVCIGYLQLH